MNIRNCKLAVVIIAVIFGGFVFVARKSSAERSDTPLDENLASVLRRRGFTGNIQSTLERRLGRRR